MARLSQGLTLAKGLITEPAKQPVYGSEMVDPYVSLIEKSVKEVAEKQQEKAAQLELDEQSLDTIAENASKEDAEYIDSKVQEIRDWEQQQIKDGVDITSLAYRRKRRDMLSSLKKDVAKSQSFAEFYGAGKKTIDQTEYLKKGPAYMRMQEEMSKPLSERDYKKATQDIIGTSSMYDMDQYLTDIVSNEKMVQDAATREGKEYITDVEIQYQQPFYQVDRKTGGVDYKMDQDWGIRTLQSMPEWALNSVAEHVETNKEKYKELQRRVLENDPNLTTEEIEDFRANATTYVAGSTLEQNLDVLEKMMQSKAQHEINIVSKVMRDRQPTATTQKTQQDQAFLNQRVLAARGGNMEAIIQELNSEAHGSRYEQNFEMVDLGNGIYKILYRSKKALDGTTLQFYQPREITVNTNDPVETKRQLGQFYNIKVTDIRKEPPTPAPEKKTKKKIGW